MTVVKQKGVSSECYAKNVRKYINGKYALARGGWNLANRKYWFSEMAMTRKMFHHDRPARAGAKNITILHQVLAFLPEECSCNGGKMTPDACMAYAEQWLAKHYPHQQVIVALHEESDKAGKRYAVHMAINRTDLLTGKRCETGGRRGKYERAAWVREMDEAWNLAQLEKGKKNSKIRDRQPRDTEKKIVERGKYSYKNNLRELIHLAINEGHPKNMEQFKKLLASWGVDIFIKNNRVYATDLDIKEAGNPKCTFNLTRLDGRFAVKQLEAASKITYWRPSEPFLMRGVARFTFNGLRRRIRRGSSRQRRARASPTISFLSSSHRSAMKICSRIRRFVMSFLPGAVTQGRFATVTPAPFPMLAMTAFAPQAEPMVATSTSRRRSIVRSTEAITLAETRLASFGKPIVGALACCHPVPSLSCSQFGEGEEYELIGGSQPL